jgi:L-asparaginase / beta-aspartyl-peptidase
MSAMGAIAIGIHGGCGTLDRALMSEVEWADARAHLAAALRAGHAVLRSGRSAVAAVEAAVIVLEDSVHFNAGYGAALNTDGFHELDASIMDGATLRAGAVGAVKRIRNPIKAARAVMEKSASVLLVAEAADAFADAQGLGMVENAYFTTPRRVEALETLKAKAKAGTSATATEAEKHGTVGAVALDRAGNLAAATSTGGFNNKPVGRVGDSPIIGAGTYARNGLAAVSGTGQGEVFIRCAAAYDIVARMAYAGQPLTTAADATVYETLSRHSIGAGFITLDAAGRVHAPFNTLGMYRGWIMEDGQIVVGTHKELHEMGRA